MGVLLCLFVGCLYLITNANSFADQSLTNISITIIFVLVYYGLVGLLIDGVMAIIKKIRNKFRR